MNTALYIVAIVVGIVALDLILWPVVRNYLRFRGKRVVTCPENEKPAGVAVDAMQDGCLVRSILGNWYAGKKCVVCGKPLDDIDWAEHRPALMGPDRKTVEWQDLPPEKVPDALLTHLPVCWNCHIASTFRREHPELVTDRPWNHQ
jgi:hypothetical protein